MPGSFSEFPPRRPSKTVKKKSVTAKDSSERTVAAKDFGIRMMVGGGICLVLPLFGLQLGRLGPGGAAATAIVGLILLVIGGISLLSSRSRRSADAATGAVKVMMWGVIGLGATIIIGVVAVFAVAFVYMRVFDHRPSFQKLHDTLKSLEGEKFEQLAIETLQGNEYVDRQVVIEELSKRHPEKPNEELARLLERSIEGTSPLREVTFPALANWGTVPSYRAVVEKTKTGWSDPTKVMQTLEGIRRRFPDAPGMLDEEQEWIQMNVAWLESDLMQKTALARLLQRPTKQPSDELTAAFLKIIRTDKRPDTLVAVFNCMAGSGTEKCVPLLEAGKKLNEPAVQKAAEDALEAIRARKGAPAAN